MKKQLLLLAIISLAVTACKKEYDDPFFGEWIITEASGDFADSNEGTMYTFSENGEVSVEKGLIANEGTYTRDDTLITVTLSGIDLQYTYTLSDNKMEWENTTADQQWVLERP
ncbi:MAG: hypothetical protein GYB31_05830 [Bacteroidetes bacterium]|nr:hypothetical protein [Bacteroidota bacterium]